MLKFFNKNEKTYNYGLGTHSEPNDIQYSINGGFPFGTNKISYQSAILMYKNPETQTSYGGNIQQESGSLCSPIYFGKKVCNTCPIEGKKCYNVIEKDIINKTVGNRQVSEDVYCDDGYGIQSCLDINKSPGNIDGNVSLDSRNVFCVNKDNKVQTFNSNISKISKCSLLIKWEFTYYYSINSLIVNSCSKPGKDNEYFAEFKYTYSPYYRFKIPSTSPDNFNLNEFIKVLIILFKKMNIELPPVTDNVILDLPPSRIPSGKTPSRLISSIKGYPIEVISDFGVNSQYIQMTVKINL